MSSDLAQQTWNAQHPAPSTDNVDVVIIPRFGKWGDSYMVTLTRACEEMEQQLNEAGIRAVGDYRYTHKPSWKYGLYPTVRIRLEVSERDLVREPRQVVMYSQHTNMRTAVDMTHLVESIKSALV